MSCCQCVREFCSVLLTIVTNYSVAAFASRISLIDDELSRRLTTYDERNLSLLAAPIGRCAIRTFLSVHRGAQANHGAMLRTCHAMPKFAFPGVEHNLPCCKPDNAVRRRDDQQANEATNNYRSRHAGRHGRSDQPQPTKTGFRSVASSMQTVSHQFAMPAAFN
jgi:hypothetical protein